MAASAQELPDPEFNPTVANPAYTKSEPRILFDEAHHNFSTVDGRYKPLSDLLRNDGYRVVRNRQPFTKESLSSFKVLIIANALGAEEMDDDGADQSAFTDEECQIVQNWVKGGGSLLLIADAGPFGSAAASLASRFAVEMSKAVTSDAANSVDENASFLIFSRDNKLLATHAITQGREDKERLDRVETIMGQSLKGPADAVALLKLADTAKDTADEQPTASASAAGRARALALKFGKGRVVVQGESAMLSALVGSEKNKIGMNLPGNDNKQYALNVLHWLSGLLKEK